MDIVQIVLFISIVLGIILVLISLFMVHGESKGVSNNYLEQSNTIKVIEAAMREMEATMEKLNRQSKEIFEELDQKYAELIFLSTSIEDAKREIGSWRNNGLTEEKPEKTDFVRGKPESLGSDLDPEISPEGSSYHKILALQENGFSISEIAQQLKMGQGEVKLILELGKAR